jgi:hypothetical protein
MRRRTLGLVFIAYGLLGIAVIVLGAVVGLDVAGRVERLAASADDTILAAAETTRTAATAFTNADTSMRDAERSVLEAAALADDASTTLDSLAAAMEVSILGAQPLVPLADDFSQIAGQAAALGESLDVVVASLADARVDVVLVGVEMERLADDLERLRDASGGDGTTPPIRLFIVLLLAWLAVPAVGAILGGVFLRRGTLATERSDSSVSAAQDAAQPEQGANVQDRADAEERP